MQQRYYDPIAGRFLSVDPVVTDEGTGDGFNRYVYGNNNPYKYVDPDGRWFALAFRGAQALVALYRAATYTATAAAAAGAAVVATSNSGSEGGKADSAPTPGDTSGAPGSGAKDGPRAGKDHTQGAKGKARDANKAANGGKMVCPKCGSTMTDPKQSQKGVTPDPHQAEGDHVDSKAQGGDGATVKDMRNIEAVCRTCNQEMGDKTKVDPQ